MSSPRVVYHPHPDTTPEGELNALAAVFAYLLKNGKADESAPEPIGRDVTKSKEDSAGENYTR